MRFIENKVIVISKKEIAEIVTKIIKEQFDGFKGCEVISTNFIQNKDGVMELSIAMHKEYILEV